MPLPMGIDTSHMWEKQTYLVHKDTIQAQCEAWIADQYRFESMLTERNIMSNATLNLSAIASAAGTICGNIKKAEDSITALYEALNTKAQALKEQKAKFGKSKRSCGLSSAFFDACIAGGVAQKTASNYLSIFRDAVNNGTKITHLGTAPKGAKGKNKGKASKSSLADLLVKAFNHDSGKSFETLCGEIEAKWDDAKIESLYEGFSEYLKSQGFDLSE